MAIKRDTIFFLVSRVFCGWNFCAHTGYTHTGSSSSPRTHTHTHSTRTHYFVALYTNGVVTLLSLFCFSFCSFSSHKQKHTHARTHVHTHHRALEEKAGSQDTRADALDLLHPHTHTHNSAAAFLSFRFFFIPHLKKTHTNPYIPCTLDFCHREKG